MQPRPQEKAEFSPVSAPQSRIKTPPLVSLPANVAPRDTTAGLVEAPTRATEEGREEQRAQDHDLYRSSSEYRRPRPTILSIPPRISLRKDTLEDLSSWSASLFSSIPSALRDSPGSSASTSSASASTTLLSNSVGSKHRTKPSVTLPTIVLHQEVPEEDEDGNEEDEEMVEHDYSHTASPLYHELMGMMQGQAAAANGVGSPGPGSPASPGFQLETASSSSHGITSRDSQLTIRFNPRRDSSRDSSASTNTLTHATIVRGASIVRRVRADVVTTPPAFSTVKGKERGRERSPIHLVEIVQDEDDIDDGNDDDESDSSSDAAGSDEDGTSGSPVGTLALTSAPNSQEDSGGCRCLRKVSPLPSPSPSPLRASFPEPVSEEHAQAQAQKEIQRAPMQGPYVTPPPSAPPMSVRRPPLPVPPIDVEGFNSVPTSSSLSWGSTEQTEQAENGIVPPTFTSTGAATPRYPAWLAAVVLPLAEFIDDSADPRALFTDLQEIAQGESGSVYSARAAPIVAPQFRPPTPHSPASGRSSPSSTPEKEEVEKGCGAQQKHKHELVAIKRVPLLPGGTEKLMDLRRELEFARTLRHANVLRMEQLYVDVVEESLWIGMELLDRSLADVLAVVGEDAGAGWLSGSDWANSEVQEGAGTGVVEIPERMVARFVWDVSDTLEFFSMFTPFWVAD